MSFEKTVLQGYLHKNIPITSALGLEVDSVSLNKVVLSAPFSKNLNHKMTVFGGSLHAVATMACWCLLEINLEKICGGGFQIVIANSNVDFLAPVEADFKAEACKPDHAAWERFLKTFERMGKARITVRSTISHGHKLCVDYTGVFVAVKTKKA